MTSDSDTQLYNGIIIIVDRMSFVIMHLDCYKVCAFDIYEKGSLLFEGIRRFIG